MFVVFVVFVVFDVFVVVVVVVVVVDCWLLFRKKRGAILFIKKYMRGRNSTHIR